MTRPISRIGSSAERNSLPSCPGWTRDATEPDVDRPQEQVGEETREHEVDPEAEVHRGVDGQEQPEPRGRIEDVAVHRADERQAAEDVRVPHRDGACAVELRGAEPADRQTHPDLVAAGAGEELAGERRQEQDDDEDGQDPERGDRRPAGRECRRGRLRLRGHQLAVS
jgi:hypothetical protein